MTRALEGIRILDFSRVLAGPYCTMILADLGADLIKVERDGVGDDLRRWGPPFMPDGESTYFLSVNRNKRSIVLDLKTESGRDLALMLVRRSDVLLENFRPGVMESLGLGSEQLKRINPRLVYCSITGYGTTGPLADRPGYDVITQGLGGLMSVTGEPDGPPMRVGVAIVDLVTGLYSAIAILGALQSRNRSGNGQRVDLSLLETCLSVMPNLTAGYLMAGVKPDRLGNAHPNVVPYKVFATMDGNLTLAVGNDGQWQRFCVALGHPELADDPRYAQNHARIARRAEVEELVSGWFRKKSTDEWVKLLEKAEVPCGPIYTIDRILTDPQIEALGMLKTVAHPTSGPLRVVGAPFHLSVDDTEPYLPPPLLGEHTNAVLKELLSLSDVDLRELEQKGAFGRRNSREA
ncbi:MAG: CoA transferase [Betaproteobacteria bacterium]|nr:CoA transferase [Betaproteobacteria bacterium]